MPYGGVVEAGIVTGQGHQQQLGSHVAVLGIAGVDAVELPAASAVWPAAAAPLGLDMRQVERRRVVELGEELGPPIAHVLEADHRRTVAQESVVPGIGNIPGPLQLAVDIAVAGP